MNKAKTQASRISGFRDDDDFGIMITTRKNELNPIHGRSATTGIIGTRLIVPGANLPLLVHPDHPAEFNNSQLSAQTAQIESSRKDPDPRRTARL
jgi:hypothetical protein